MAPRRVLVRFRLALFLATITTGALLTATPRADQDPDRLPVGTGTGKPPIAQGPGMPSISVPRVNVPAIAVPTVNTGRQTPASSVQTPVKAAWMVAARVEAMVQAERLGLDYLPGEVIVKFRDGMGTADQTRAAQVLTSQPATDAFEWVGPVAVLRDPTQPNAYILADQLKAQPEVEYAEPNFIYRTGPALREEGGSPLLAPSVASSRPNRGRSLRMAGVPNDTNYTGYQWNFSLINMPGAWDLQPGGSADIIVAVIDTGISGSAGTLTYPIWTGSAFQTLAMPYAVNTDLPASRHVSGKDYVGIKVAAPLVDLDGHGTHVSSTIGEATNNAALAAGIAYNARIMPIKVCLEYWDAMIARGLAGTTGFPDRKLSSCASSDVADGVRYAVDNGARVLNLSLSDDSPSTTMQNALIYAAGKGAFIAVAMGNSGQKGNPTMYPAAYAASLDGVMSVSAIGFNSALAYYSSTGPHCEITAPGGDEVSGAGRQDSGVIWQSTLLYTDQEGNFPRFDRYQTIGYTGTSMAAPHVAGLAALILSQKPSLTGAQVEMIIRASAKDLGATGRDDSFGFGLIQPQRALFGYGIRR